MKIVFSFRFFKIKCNCKNIVSTDDVHFLWHKMIYDTYGPTIPLWVYFKLKWCCVVRLFKKYTYMTTNNLALTMIGFLTLSRLTQYVWVILMTMKGKFGTLGLFAELIKIWSLTTKGIPLSVVVWCTFTFLHGSMLYVHLSPCKYGIN